MTPRPRTVARLLTAAAVVASMPVLADAPCAELRIDGVTPDAGPLQIAVYGSREAFRRKALLATTAAVGTASTFRLPLCELTVAEVAVVVTQDLDGDGEFDTNLVGIPQEPWGASGRRTLGPPSWERARVALAPGATIVVSLR